MGKSDFKKPREMKGYCCPRCDGPEKKYKKVRARRTRQKLKRDLKAEQASCN
jgi:hypothetical protein